MSNLIKKHESKTVILLPAMVAVLAISAYLYTGFMVFVWGGLTLLGIGLIGRRALSGKADTVLLGTASDDALDSSAKLRRRISKLQFADNSDVLSERAAGQLLSAQERLKKYKQVLNSKFSPTEMTFERYNNAGQSVFDAICSNLNRISEMLELFYATNINETRSRFKLLEGSTTDHDKAEFETFKERLVNMDAQRIAILERLANNELALNRFDEAIKEVAGIRTNIEGGAVDLDSALESLNELAARAGKYSQ